MRQPPRVVMDIAQLAPAFGLTVHAVRQYIKRGAPARGDQIEVGEFAAFIARLTIGSQDDAQVAV